MDFEKYQKVRRYGDVETEGIEVGRCLVFPKLDGCFDYKTRILLSDGSYESIGKIVNQKMDVEVLSYDTKNKKLVKNKIVNWFKKPTTKEEWLTVEVSRTAGGLYRGGGRNTQLLCTKNHHFIKSLDGETTEAKNLTIGDEVYVPQALPTDIQKQILLGTLLGDGSAYPNKEKAYTNGFSFTHSEKQKEYLLFKNKLLGNLYNASRTRISGYGSKMYDSNTKCNKITQILYELCYKNYKKTVTHEWLNELNSIGIAIWYMDDGNLQGNRAKLSIEGFTEKEQKIIQKWFSSKGYDCYLQSNDYTILVFSPEGTKDLFFDINSYIIESMEYKLLPEFRGTYFSFDSFINVENSFGLIKRKIMNITKGKKECYHKQGMYKYDIEVENSHTYFAENVLVHNSNASTWWDEEEQTVRAGSRNRTLSLKKDNAGFYEWVLQQKNLSDFHERYPYLRLYGEWLVPHSLKTYRDDAWRNFYVFDVVDEDGNYLHYDVYKELLEEFNIDYLAPLGIVVNGTKENFYHYLPKNNVLIQDGEGEGEGVVIKNYDFVNRFGRMQWAKIVTSSFKEKNHKEMGAPVTENSRVESEIVEKYVTLGRVDKIYNKIKTEEGGWRSKYIPRLLNTVYYDLITEESWNFVKEHKDPTIDFKMLKQFVINQIKTVKQELF